jgi:hypothetical protein
MMNSMFRVPQILLQISIIIVHFGIVRQELESGAVGEKGVFVRDLPQMKPKPGSLTIWGNKYILGRVGGLVLLNFG